MIGARLGFFCAVSLAALAWVSLVFLSLSTRFENQRLISSLQNGEMVEDAKALTHAARNLETATRSLPCDVALLTGLTLVRAQLSDIALANDPGDDASMAMMREAMVRQLSCTPRDGKVWLDLAMLESYREGFARHASDAYLMSASVAPGESWLAEKRLMFALAFRPMLDEKALAAARHDLAVLERAHPNRMTAVQQAAEAENIDVLYARFGATRAMPKDSGF